MIFQWVREDVRVNTSTLHSSKIAENWLLAISLCYWRKCREICCNFFQIGIGCVLRTASCVLSNASKYEPNNWKSYSTFRAYYVEVQG